MLALRACAVTFVLCAVAYPAVVWGVAQLLFPSQAEGSLIYGDGRTVIGSELIAQQFESDRYFHPRPSAVDYKADAAGGSNLGTNNPDLRKAIAGRVEALKATPEQPGAGRPGDGLGLGPRPGHQPGGRCLPGAARRRRHEGLPIDKVRALIERMTNRSGAILGAPPRVNVLLLNLALDKEQSCRGH